MYLHHKNAPSYILLHDFAVLLCGDMLWMVFRSREPCLFKKPTIVLKLLVGWNSIIEWHFYLFTTSLLCKQQTQTFYHTETQNKTHRPIKSFLAVPENNQASCYSTAAMSKQKSSKQHSVKTAFSISASACRARHTGLRCWWAKSVRVRMCDLKYKPLKERVSIRVPY